VILLHLFHAWLGWNLYVSRANDKVRARVSGSSGAGRLASHGWPSSDADHWLRGLYQGQRRRARPSAGVGVGAATAGATGLGCGSRLQSEVVSIGG
jgi:hypothetical protein